MRAGRQELLAAGRVRLPQRASGRAPLREHINSARNREIGCRPQHEIERLMLEVGAVLPEAGSEGGALELGEHPRLGDRVVWLPFQQRLDAPLEDVDAIAD